MGKHTPSTPTPPDPTATANAQSAANIATADEMAKLNRVNQTGPTGTSTYAQNPDGTWTQNTSYTPTEAALFQGSQGIASGALTNLSNQKDVSYGANANPNAPVSSIQGAGQGIQSQVRPSGPIQSSLDLTNIQAIPTADHTAYQQAQDAVYKQAASRLDPQWNQAQTAIETQLIDQGIPQNSDAWNRAMTQFSQQKNDAYTSAENQAVLTGNTVEQNQFGMGLQANQAGVSNANTAGTFANTAQQQRFGQNLEGMAARNAAQNQGFSQGATAGQFANTAAQQGFQNAATQTGLHNSAVAQNLQQLISQFTLPNTITNPTFAGVPQTNVANTDVIGAQSLATQAQLANYQNQTAQNSAKKGGLGQLGGTLGAAAIMSDRRTKTAIRKIGLRMNGLPLYAFRYLGKYPTQIGLMAQDVERLRPSAVREIRGIKHVDYQLALAA